MLAFIHIDIYICTCICRYFVISLLSLLFVHTYDKENMFACLLAFCSLFGLVGCCCCCCCCLTSNSYIQMSLDVHSTNMYLSLGMQSLLVSCMHKQIDSQMALSQHHLCTQPPCWWRLTQEITMHISRWRAQTYGCCENERLRAQLSAFFTTDWQSFNLFFSIHEIRQYLYTCIQSKVHLRGIQCLSVKTPHQQDMAALERAPVSTFPLRGAWRTWKCSKKRSRPPGTYLPTG